MDILKSASKLFSGGDKEKFGASLLQKAGIFCWETGLGPVINRFPDLFGQHAVLYFPGRSGKFSLPCHESGSRILLALTENELKNISGMLLQSPGVEIWLKDGWYAGTARLLSAEEQTEETETIPDEVFFGEAGKNFRKKSLRKFRLIEVTLSAPCTGTNGPGSKAWVWALAAVLLLFSKKKK